MNKNFPVGAKVTVTFEGTIEEHPERSDIDTGMQYKGDGCSGFLRVRDGNQVYHYIWVHDYPYDNGKYPLKVTQPPVPEYWPPQRGDIWSDGGAEYFARYLGEKSGIVLIPTDGTVAGSSYVYQSDMRNWKQFAARNPRLLRRSSMLS